MGFKENLKSELEYSGMLVKELADKSGVKKSSLDKYLDTTSQLPSIETGVKIADALDVTVEYLVNGEDNQIDSLHKLSNTSRHIAKLAEQLKPEKREFILECIRGLLTLKDWKKNE